MKYFIKREYPNGLGNLKRVGIWVLYKKRFLNCEIFAKRIDSIAANEDKCDLGQLDAGLYFYKKYKVRVMEQTL